MKKIAIIGPGAIGGTLAAWLASRPGNELSICARTPFDHLVVDTPFGILESTPRVITEPETVEKADWIIVTTKTYQIKSAAQWVPSLSHSESRVAVVQNGVEHLENFRSIVPEDRIIPVIIDCPAERFEPGRILQRAPVKMTVPKGAAAAEFFSLFPKDKMVLVQSEDWSTEAWKKLCINCGGAISALLNQPANIVREEHAASVMKNLIRECVAVARAEGATIEDSIVEEIVASQAAAPEGAMNSIHADLVAKRPMEWDARNGVVVRRGRQHGLNTPCNQMAVDLLRALEASYTTPGLG